MNAGAADAQQNAYSNLPSQNGGNEKKEYKKTNYKPAVTKSGKPQLKRPSNKTESASVGSDVVMDPDAAEVKTTASVIRGIKNKSKPHQKKIKLI